MHTYHFVDPGTRLCAQERLLTNIRYEEEVQEAEASGFQFARATTDQLENFLEAFSRQNVDLTDDVVEEVVWEEELEEEVVY